MKTLLVPVDFSTGIDLLLKKSAQLAGELGARLVLLHIVEPVASYVPVGASMDVIVPPPEDVESDLVPAQHERLEHLAVELRNKGLTVEVIVVEGLPVEEILTQAGVLEAAYIVMASHGHGALYHLFTGSVVTGVLKGATCPVVVVPVRQTVTSRD